MTNQEINVFSRKVSQASKSELVVIMYEIAIKYIEDGLKSLEDNDIDNYRLNLKRAKSVINELNSALDMTLHISHELSRLYVFMTGIIVKADIRKETDELIRVKNMLIKLSESFKEVSRLDKSGPIMENTQTVYAGLTYSKDSLNENMYSDVNRGFKV